MLSGIGLFFGGCNNAYHKILKSDNPDEKFKIADSYFEKGEYQKAIPIYEDLLNIYRGTSNSEQLYYRYAFSEYKLRELEVASFYFKTLISTFPMSKYAEEATYLSAYSEYLQSGDIELDQASTKQAIEDFKYFAKKYPDSKMMEDCNKYMDALDAKLEEKTINSALLYYKIQDYKAAIWALRNVTEKYPGSPRNEELNFTILKSSYLLAQQSIDEKKEERYLASTQYFHDFESKYPKSKMLGEARRMYSSSNEELNRIKLNK